LVLRHKTMEFYQQAKILESKSFKTLKLYNVPILGTRNNLNLVTYKNIFICDTTDTYSKMSLEYISHSKIL